MNEFFECLVTFCTDVGRLTIFTVAVDGDVPGFRIRGCIADSGGNSLSLFALARHLGMRMAV